VAEAYLGVMWEHAEPFCHLSTCVTGLSFQHYPNPRRQASRTFYINLQATIWLLFVKDGCNSKRTDDYLVHLGDRSGL